MGRFVYRGSGALLGASLLLAASAAAQQPVTLPEASP
jgi:hypothetical protein